MRRSRFAAGVFNFSSPFSGSADNHLAQQNINVANRFRLQNPFPSRRTVLIKQIPVRICNLADGIRKHRIPPVCRCSIRRCHIQNAHFRRAENNRRLILDPGRNSQFQRRTDNVFQIQIRRQIHRRHVQRLGKCLLQADGAAKFPVIVLRLPVVNPDWLVRQQFIGGKAVFKRGQIYKKLKRGSRLPQCLCRPVKLALVIVKSACHRLNRAVAVQNDHRPLADVVLPVGADIFAQNIFCPLLQIIIQCRFDINIFIAGLHHIRQKPHHIIAEIPRAENFAVISLPNRQVNCAFPFFKRNGTGAPHELQHNFRTLQRQFFVPQVIVFARRFQRSGQNSRLAQIQILCLLVKKTFRRRIQPVRAAAEKHPVQIYVQNLFLAEVLFQPLCQQIFLHFAPDAFLPGQKQVFRHLLRNRRRSLRIPHLGNVDSHRPRKSDIVKPAVFEKAPVFGINHRLINIRRQIVHIDRLGKQRAVRRDFPPVCRQNFHPGLPFDIHRLGKIRQRPVTVINIKAGTQRQNQPQPQSPHKQFQLP